MSPTQDQARESRERAETIGFLASGGIRPEGAGVGPPPGRRIAIVGTAPGAEECPVGPEWERWAANWSQVCYATPEDPHPGRHSYSGTPNPEHGRFGRIYELHDALTRDTKAEGALSPEILGESCSPNAEVWCFFPAPKWEAKIVPVDALCERFGQYFTNSISWMIAHAIEEHLAGQTVDEIGVFGVNVATAKEFGHERPSVEYFLGWARGLGIKVTIPEQSDLLHCANLYGHAQETWYEHKLLAERLRIAEQIAGIDRDARPYTVHALESTLGELDYLIRLRFHTRPSEEA